MKSLNDIKELTDSLTDDQCEKILKESLDERLSDLNQFLTYCSERKYISMLNVMKIPDSDFTAGISGRFFKAI